MSKQKPFKSFAMIQDIAGQEDYLNIMIDDPDFNETDDTIAVPFRLLGALRDYIDERIDYLKQHGLIEEKKGGIQ